MSEFEDFDAEFEQIAYQDKLAREAEAAYADAKGIVFGKLAEMQWRSLRVESERNIATNELLYMLTAEDIRQEMIQKTGMEIDLQEIAETFDETINEIIAQQYVDKIAIEELLIHKITMLVDKDRRNRRSAMVDYEKLHLFAEMIIVHDMHPSDELVRALNVLVGTTMYTERDDDVRTMYEIVRHELAQQQENTL